MITGIGMTLTVTDVCSSSNAHGRRLNFKNVMDVSQQCLESKVEQELSLMLILLAMPRDDSYRNNEMDASSVGNGVEDSCTKSIMDAN
jgi:hypothetical protein